MRRIIILLGFICFQAWAQDVPEMQVIDKIIDDGKSFLGYKYRERVAPGYVFDCSGYVSYIFGKNNIQLPRSSAAMAKDVLEVPLEEARAGDLLFFKGRDVNSKHIGHVAMVVENTENGIFMMHASRSGIVLEPLKDDYYTRRFVFAGRLPLFNGPDAGFQHTLPFQSGLIHENDSIAGLFFQISQQWKEAFNSGDAQNLTPLYSADACYVSPQMHGLEAHGRDRLIAEFQADIDRGGLIDSLELLKLDVSGDNASLLYAHQVSNNGLLIEGQSLLVLNNIDGVWLITFHMSIE